MPIPSSNRRIRLEIGSTAWADIGRLPSASFRRLRQQLELLSEESLMELSSGTAPGDAACPLTVRVDGHVVSCLFSAAEQTLTLMQLRPASNDNENAP